MGPAAIVVGGAVQPHGPDQEPMAQVVNLLSIISGHNRAMERADHRPTIVITDNHAVPGRRLDVSERSAPWLFGA
jgi:hypothetical protein